jgi:hypothetical protein
MKNLELNVKVDYVEEHFSERKQDIVGDYWRAEVVEGLEEYTKDIPHIRPKDLINFAQSFKSKTDAIKKLGKNLSENYDLHGTLHIMSDEEWEEFLNRKEKQGCLVLR